MKRVVGTVVAGVVLAVGVGTAMVASADDAVTVAAATTQEDKQPDPSIARPLPDVDPVIAIKASGESYAERLLGLTAEEADAQAISDGYETRVISRFPGDDMAIRADFRGNRIDLKLDGGKVIEVSIG